MENMDGGSPTALGEPSLKGKVALVTGGNAGIGYATVRKLAARGAKVYMAARSGTKSQTAIEQLHEERLGLLADQVSWLPLDLSDPKSVVRAVKDMKACESRLDILINNAGIGTNGLEMNDAGWELAMAVCHVGHFALNLGLMPLLKSAAETEGADVRVVTLSSMIIEMIPPDLDVGFTSPTYLSDHKTFGTFSTWLMGVLAFRVDMPRYALAKLANVLFAKELQRRLDAHGIPIISITMHPGAASTDSIPYVFRWLVRPLVWLTALSPDVVAEMPVFAATDPAVRREEAQYKGSYLLPPGTVAPAHAAADDEQQLRGLWDNTLQQLNGYLTKSGLAALESL